MEVVAEALSSLSGEEIGGIFAGFAMLPLIMYMLPCMLLEKFLPFLFFSGMHEWWHNLILAGCWIGLYWLIYQVAFGLISACISNQFDAVADDYGVALFDLFSIPLYLLGIAFPLYVLLCDASPIPQNLAWLGICFPAIMWIYYLFSTGLGLFVILLRQFLVVTLCLIFLSMLLFPIVIAVCFYLVCIVISAACSGPEYEYHYEYK